MQQRSKREMRRFTCKAGFQRCSSRQVKLVRLRHSSPGVASNLRANVARSSATSLSEEIMEQTQTTQATQQPAMQIPQLTQASVLPQADFAAFKLEEKVSFVRKYDPRVTAIEGYRHCVIRYRNTDPKVAAKVAQMVTVPVMPFPADLAVFADSEDAKKLSSCVMNMLEDAQDEMIRGFIDSGISNVYWDNITLPKVLADMTAVRMSNRLTREQVEAWAKVAMLEACNTRADQISEAKQYNDEQKQKQRAGTLNAYVELAAKLAAPVPNIGQEQATALKNLLVVAKLDDDMTKVLKNKLEAILNPKIAESGDL